MASIPYIEPRAYEFFKDTWRIELGGHGCFLLLGKEKAMLIDTGMNRCNLREFIKESITDLPVIVANTHGHFDHTGGNGWFSEVYMSAFAAGEAKNVFPNIEHPEDFPTNYEITVIEEGYVFDLGGRRLKTIATPCHSPGSLSFIDTDKRLLFTGDEFEAGQILIGGPRQPGQPSKAELFMANLNKYKSHEAEFDYICPAHNGTPIVKDYIDRYIELAKKIFAGEEGMTKVTSATWDGHGRPVPPYMRRLNTLGTAGVVYNYDEAVEEAKKR